MRFLTAGLAFLLCAGADAGSLWIFRDSLESGWQDWSWSSTRDYSVTDPVQAGSVALSVEAAAWPRFLIGLLKLA